MAALTGERAAPMAPEQPVVAHLHFERYLFGGSELNRRQHRQVEEAAEMIFPVT